MTNVKIIGAGQLGSRHLQALQAVDTALRIEVIDPSPTSLDTARQRFEAVAGQTAHEVRFSPSITRSERTDVAIIATNANTRYDAATALLAASEVRFLILEKLLFDRPQQYEEFPRHLARSATHAWVNCPMRIMPPYEAIRQKLDGQAITYRVSGSQFGLVTNAIHYLDHVVHLTGCGAFTIDGADLDPEPVPSKRAGFLELTGRLFARFEDGSRCEVVCHATSNAPVVVEISTPSARWLVRESEGRLWHSSATSAWQWEEQPARIPFQSEMTTSVMRSLLATGDCGLTPLAQSITTHQRLLAPLRDQLHAHGNTFDHYPFT